MPRRESVLLLILLSFLVSASPTPAEADAADMWDLISIQEDHYFWNWNPSNALAIDGASVHAAYAGDKVYLVRTELKGANIFVIDEDNGAGGATSLAVDSDGNDLIAYIMQGTVRTAVFDGELAVITTVDEGPEIEGNIGFYADLAGCHLTYFNAEDGLIYYRYADACLEYCEPIVAATTSVSVHSLFEDFDSNPACVFVGSSGLEISVLSGAAFAAPDTIDSSVSGVTAVDSVRRTAVTNYIAYVDSGELVFASGSGSSYDLTHWSDREAAGPIDLNLNSDEDPEILYRSNDATWLRVFSSSSWTDENVASLGRTAAGQLAYYSDGARAIVRVEDQSASHVLSLVDDVGTTALDEGAASGRDSTIAARTDDFVMAYRKISAPGGREYLILADYDETTISTQNVFSFLDQGKPSDLSVDPTGRILLAFTSDPGTGTKRIVALTGEPGDALDETEVFSTSCDSAGPFIETVIGGDGSYWVIYSNTCEDGSSESIDYGLVTGKGVIASADGAMSVDIGAAMDEDGYPWIAFVDPATTPPTLRLAVHDTSGWSVRDLASGDYQEPSVAFDASGRCHVVALDNAFGVRDFVLAGETLKTTTVSAGSFEGSIGLAADDYGVLHTAFRTAAGAVRYAFLDVSGWRVMNIYNYVKTVDRIAVAANGNAMPRLLFYDLYSKDPVLASLNPCLDADGDGHLSIECDGDDCHDLRSDIFTGATEYCDGLDNNCNGDKDEDCIPLPDDDTDDDSADDTGSDDSMDDTTDDDFDDSAEDDTIADDDTLPTDSDGNSTTVTGPGGSSCGCGC